MLLPCWNAEWAVTEPRICAHIATFLAAGAWLPQATAPFQTGAAITSLPSTGKLGLACVGYTTCFLMALKDVHPGEAAQTQTTTMRSKGIVSEGVPLQVLQPFKALRAYGALRSHRFRNLFPLGGKSSIIFFFCVLKTEVTAIVGLGGGLAKEAVGVFFPCRRIDLGGGC